MFGFDSPMRSSIASALMGMQPGMNMPWGSGGAPASMPIQPNSWLANMMAPGGAWSGLGGGGAMPGAGMFGGSAPSAAPPPAAAPAAPPPPSFFGGGGMPQFGGFGGGFGGGMPNFGGAFNGAAINASLNPIMPPGGISGGMPGMPGWTGGIAGFGGWAPWDPTGGQMPPPGMEIRPNWQDAVSAASAGSGSPGE